MRTPHLYRPPTAFDRFVESLICGVITGCVRCAVAAGVGSLALIAFCGGFA